MPRHNGKRSADGDVVGHSRSRASCLFVRSAGVEGAFWVLISCLLESNALYERMGHRRGRMLSIRCELTGQDLVAFNTHFMESSGLATHNRKTFRLVAAIVTSAGIILTIGVGGRDLPGAIIVGALATLVVWVATPLLWRYTYRRCVERVASRQGLGTTGPFTLTVDDQGVRELTEQGETAILWTAIRGVEETDNHLFVFFSGVQAFVIPKRVGEAQWGPLVGEIKRRTQARQIPSESLP